MIKSKKTYWLVALFVAALWGSSTVCIKVAYGFFSLSAADTASQLMFIGARFILAGILGEIIFGLSEKTVLRPKTGQAFSHVLVLALLQVFVLYGLYSTGLARASGTSGAMINGTSTFFTILFSTLVFKTERPTARKFLACLLGFAAIAVMNLGGEGAGLTFSLTGEGALLLSQCVSGLCHNITKRFTVTDSPAMLCAWQFFIGGTALFTAGWLLGGRLQGNASGYAVLLYISLVSAVTFSLWGKLMQYHPVSRVNVFSLANPLFGVLFSALLLGETQQAFRPQTLLALAMIAGGIVLVCRKEE